MTTNISNLAFYIVAKHKEQVDVIKAHLQSAIEGEEEATSIFTLNDVKILEEKAEVGGSDGSSFASANES